MRDKRHEITGILAVVTCCVMLLSSCSRSGSPHTSVSSESPSASASQTGARLASSLKAYTQSILDADKQSQKMGDKQRNVVEKAAKGDGTVSRADYEQAWANYKQCIVSRGWTSPNLREADGLYAEPPINAENMTEAQTTKLSQDTDYCATTYVVDVDQLYRTQVANPTLSTANVQLIVKCLVASGVVSSDYTAEEFQKDSSSLDFSDSKVQSCLIKYGYHAVDASKEKDSLWKPIG